MGEIDRRLDSGKHLSVLAGPAVLKESMIAAALCQCDTESEFVPVGVGRERFAPARRRLLQPACSLSHYYM